MSADPTIESIAGMTPRVLARVAAVFYVLNIVTSLIAFSGRSQWAVTSGRVATAAYVVVTILFYYLFRPVNRNLSLVATFVGLLGSAWGVLGSLHLTPFRMSSLVFFGIYCLLIGCLILRSAYLPRILGALMVLAGLGWLTFISPQLVHTLSPYNYYPGGIGEILLTLWLLVLGVDSQRWSRQAAGLSPAGSVS